MFLALLRFLLLTGSLRIQLYSIDNKILTSVDAATNNGCETFEECVEVNLAYAKKIIQTYRCQYIEDSVTNPTKRLIQFTHVPKAGGTSIDSFLSKGQRSSQRYDNSRAAHESYGSAEFNTGHSRLFAVVIRHPVSKAISMYNYMRSNPGSNDHSADWHYTNTHKSATLREWVHEPVIIASFSGNGMFNETLANSHLNLAPAQLKKKPLPASRADNHQFAHTPIPDRFPLSTVEFVSHINDSIPNPDFRCIARMKTALLLIKRYSAVSTLEHLERFWHVLSARAGLDMTNATIKQVTSYKANKSRKLSTEEEEEYATAVLSKTFRCDILMWSIAGM